MKKQQLLEFPIFKCPQVLKIQKDILYIMTACIYHPTKRDPDILTLTFYDRVTRKPLYVVYSTRKRFYTLKVQESKFSKATIQNLLECGWYKNEKFYRVLIADEVSKQCGVDFFLSTEKDTLYALDQFQQSIRKDEYESRQKNLRMKTDAVMNQVGELPKDIDKWINNVPLLSSRYIYYKRHGKKLFGFCTSCKHKVPLQKAKHNTPGRCPACKSKVTLKAEGISRNVSDSSEMAVFQRGSGKIEDALILRCFSIHRNYRKNYMLSETTFHEHTRYVIKKDATFMFVHESKYSQFYHRYQAPAWHRQKSISHVKDTFLYSSNLTGALKGTPWQYCCIKQFADKAGSFDALKYLQVYAEKPSLEYLVKLKLFKIVSETLSYHGPVNSVKFSGKNLTEVLGVSKNDLPFLQKFNISSHELKLYQAVKEHKHTMTDEVIQWCRKHNNCNEAFEPVDIINFLNYGSPTKIIRYLTKQHNPNRLMSNIIRDWSDYITNAHVLHYDTALDSVTFPRNLKEAHDRAANLCKIKQNEKHIGVISAMESKLNEMYAYQKDKFIIRAPGSLAEIIEEGSKLNHCVGNYIDRIADGKTVILFIRKADALDKPFFTLEYQGNRVMQCRGYKNCDMTEEVKKFVENWKKGIHKKIDNRIKVTIPA